MAIAGCGSDGGEETGESDRSGDVDVFDLEVGVCLADFQDATELETIEASSCSEPHSDEIFASGSIPDGDFPGMDVVEAKAQDMCIAEFDDFVGISYEDSVLDVGYLTPTEESWNDGDRARALYGLRPGGRDLRQPAWRQALRLVGRLHGRSLAV